MGIAALNPSYALQGNIDPATLYGSPDAIRTQVKRTLDSYAEGNGGSREGHVFNLGHGLSYRCAQPILLAAYFGKSVLFATAGVRQPP